MAARATRVAIASLCAALASAVSFVKAPINPRGALLPRSRIVTMASSTAGAGADEFDAVVIGAGLGGLSAAALLASRGLKVRWTRHWQGRCTRGMQTDLHVETDLPMW